MEAQSKLGYGMEGLCQLVAIEPAVKKSTHLGTYILECMLACLYAYILMVTASI